MGKYPHTGSPKHYPDMGSPKAALAWTRKHQNRKSMKISYEKMSTADFDTILDQIVGKMTAASILAIDGVREIVQEELNNEVLDQWARENPELARDWTDEEAQIQRLDRAEVIELLEGACIQCYDHETDEVLKVALLENVKDGTITLPS